MLQKPAPRRSTRTGWVRGSGALLLVAALAFFIQAGHARADDSPTATASVITLAGEPNDPVTAGQSYLWRGGPDRITTSIYHDSLQDIDHVGAVVGTSGDTHSFSFQFSPPKGEPFTAGTTYTSGANFQRPYVQVSGDGRGCNDAGTFTVLDYAPDLSRLWLTFRHNCLYATPADYGEIRINEPVDPDVVVAPTRMEWSTQHIGGSAPHVPITVINTGAQPLSISTASITGPDPDDFTATAPSTCTGIEAGASCAVDVGFTPSQFGDRSATLTLADSSAEGSHAVPLSGPVGPTSTVTDVYEAAYDPGNVTYRTGPDVLTAAIGTSAVTVNVARSTEGSSATPLRFSAPSGQQLTVGTTYHAVHDTTATAQDAGISFGSCNTEYGTFTVRDIDVDAQRVWLTFVDHCNDPTAPSLFGEIRYGEPTDPEMLVAPARVGWPDQGVGAAAHHVPITVFNTGRTPLTLASTSVSGPGAADFSAPALGSCATIAVGDSCVLSVGFTPSNVGAESATLTILDSSAQGAHTVELNGAGVPQSTVTMTTTQLVGRGPEVTGTGTWNSGSDHIGVRGSTAGLSVNATHTKTDGDRAQYQLTIAPSSGTFAPNTTYDGATGTGSSGNSGHVAGTPELELTQNHQVCLNYAGHFTVLDIAPDLSRLWVVYAVVCRGVDYFGEVRYGEPTDPAGLVTPKTMVWPDDWDGPNSGAVPVTVTNTSHAPWTVLGASISGDSASDFGVDAATCTGMTLAPTESCTYHVTMATRTSSGAATLAITDTSPAGGHYVDLGGFSAKSTTATLVGTTGDPITGGTPQFFWSGADRVEINQSNPAHVELLLGHGADSAEYRLTFDAPVGTTLSSGTSYENAQTTAGQPALGHPGIAIANHGLTCDTTGRFTVRDLAPDLSRVWIDYEIHCLNSIQFGEIRYHEPAAPDLAVGPSRLTWPVGVQGRVPVNLVNLGTATVSVTNLQLQGANPADFSTGGFGNCASIAPGATCTIDVTFTPRGTGTRQAGLAITDTATPYYHLVDLSGPGLPPTPTPPSHTSAPPPPAPAKTTVTTKNSAKSVQAHHTMKVAVTVKPAQKGRAVQLQQLSGTKWKKVSTARTDSKGHATFSVKPSKKGKVTYRVQAPADPKHATGTSKKFTVKAT